MKPLIYILFVLVSSCCSSDTFLSRDSNIPSVDCKTESMIDLKGEIESYLAREFPIGTRRAEVENFTKMNFKNCDYRENEISAKFNYLSIMPVGKNWISVTFYFKSGILSKIEVKNESALRLTA